MGRRPVAVVMLAVLVAMLGSPSSAGAAPNGCSNGSPAYGVGIAITPEFVGTDDVAIAAYPGELINYDVTVFLRAEAGGVIVCPIFGGTVRVTLPDGTGPFTVATGLALGIGQSTTFSDVPASSYAVDEADVVPGTRRVEAIANVSATSEGPDDGPDDDAPVTASAVAPTFLLAPSTQLSISADRPVSPSGSAVVWMVTERNDTPPGYFPAALGDAHVELSTDGGATSFAVLTPATPGMTGDNGNGLLGVGEVWTWTITTNPVDDTTITATAFGTGPRGRIVTFPDDPEERAAASVDVIAPSTVVGISAGASQVPFGGQVTWTVTEGNDGDVPLDSPSVRLDADGGDDGDVTTLTAPPASGDSDGDGVLDPGETWAWTVATHPSGDLTVTATGHGVDPLGRDITFPADPDERAATSVVVVPLPELPATGPTPGTALVAQIGLLLVLAGSCLVFAVPRRDSRSGRGTAH